MTFCFQEKETYVGLLQQSSAEPKAPFNQQKKTKGHHDTLILFKARNLQWFRYIIMRQNLLDHNILEVTALTLSIDIFATETLYN